MSYQEDDRLAAALRDALRGDADQFEPAGDGLAQIRQRLTEPWPHRRARVLLTRLTNLEWLLRVRAEPLAERARGKWSAAAPMIGALARRHPPAHASRAGTPARRRAQIAVLRSAVAVAGAVMIVVAGVYGLAQLRQTVITITNFTGSPSTSTGPDSSPAPSHPGHRSYPAAPGAASPVSQGRRHPSHRPSPLPTCSPAPSPSPSGHPSPSVFPSPSRSPSTGPTSSPTASASSGASATPIAGAAALASQAVGARAVCVTPSPKRQGRHSG